MHFRNFPHNFPIHRCALRSSSRCAKSQSLNSKIKIVFKFKDLKPSIPWRFPSLPFMFRDERLRTLQDETSMSPRDDSDDDILQKVVAAATVGTPYILNAPNVQEPPPHVNRPIPVPSCFHDERGEIHNLLIGGASRRTSPIISNVLPDFIKARPTIGGGESDGKRINILYSKA
jgi:hypothetical protein